MAESCFKAKEACSFLKKRTKKLLPPGLSRFLGPRPGNKNLLLLFFGKEGLPSSGDTT
jgi:hypothetical protein